MCFAGQNLYRFRRERNVLSENEKLIININKNKISTQNIKSITFYDKTF